MTTTTADATVIQTSVDVPQKKQRKARAKKVRVPKPRKLSVYQLFCRVAEAEGTTFDGCQQPYFPLDRGSEEGPGERRYRERVGLDPEQAKVKKLRDVPELDGKELKSIQVTIKVKPTKKFPFPSEAKGITHFRAGAGTSTLLEKGRIRALDAHVQKRCRDAVQHVVDRVRRDSIVCTCMNYNKIAIDESDLDDIVASLKHARQDEDKILDLLNGTLSPKQRKSLPHDVWSVIENHVRPSVGLRELTGGLVVMVEAGYIDVPIAEYDSAFEFSSVSKGLVSYTIRRDYLERRLEAALLRTVSETNDLSKPAA